MSEWKSNQSGSNTGERGGKHAELNDGNLKFLSLTSNRNKGEPFNKEIWQVYQMPQKVVLGCIIITSSKIDRIFRKREREAKCYMRKPIPTLLWARLSVVKVCEDVVDSSPSGSSIAERAISFCQRERRSIRRVWEKSIKRITISRCGESCHVEPKAINRTARNRKWVSIRRVWFVMIR